MWVFSDASCALRFAELFAFVNHTFLSGFLSAAMFRTVGDALGHALEVGAVRREELFSTDEHVLKKMRRLAENDAEMNVLWRRMNLEASVLPDFTEAPGAVAELKSRMVDPLCLRRNGEVARLSDVLPDWGDRVRLQSRPKIYGLRFA
jgi:hypothetical protein